MNAISSARRSKYGENMRGPMETGRIGVGLVALTVAIVVIVVVSGLAGHRPWRVPGNPSFAVPELLGGIPGSRGRCQGSESPL